MDPIIEWRFNDEEKNILEQEGEAGSESDDKP
jgi:hypothetical protein